MRSHLDIFCPRGIISRTLFADAEFFCALTRGDLVEHRYLRGTDGCCLKAENPKILPKERILPLCSLGRQKYVGCTHKHGFKMAFKVCYKLQIPCNIR